MQIALIYQANKSRITEVGSCRVHFGVIVARRATSLEIWSAGRGVLFVSNPPWGAMPDRLCLLLLYMLFVRTPSSASEQTSSTADDFQGDEDDDDPDSFARAVGTKLNARIAFSLVFVCVRQQCLGPRLCSMRQSHHQVTDVIRNHLFHIVLQNV